MKLTEDDHIILFCDDCTVGEMEYVDSVDYTFIGNHKHVCNGCGKVEWFNIIYPFKPTAYHEDVKNIMLKAIEKDELYQCNLKELAQMLLSRNRQNLLDPSL